MARIDVLLLDLDGVVRRYDHDAVAAIEQRSGLTSGSLNETAFQPRLLRAVTTGEMTYAAWVDEIARSVGPVAAQAWAAQRPDLDKAVLTKARSIRTSGVRVCLLTNGTDRIDADLEDLGIKDDFDAVFNSADLGFAKPDLRIFMHVLRELDVDGSRVLYLADSAEPVRGAEALGIQARVFESPADLEAFSLG